MGQPIQNTLQSASAVMQAPQSQVGLRVIAISGTAYVSNASGQATVAAGDVQFMLGMGWTVVGPSYLMLSPNARPGVTFTGPSGTVYTSGSSGTVSVSQADSAYALQIGFVPFTAPLIGSGAVGNLVRKIKASMAAAQKSNPVINQPLIAPPAWVTSTAYAWGQIVSSAGAAGVSFACATTAGGTSGATNPTLNEVGVSDGTLFWVPVGGIPTAAPAFDTPVVTFNNASGLALTVNAATSGTPNTDNFRFYGGVPFANGSAYVVTAANTYTPASGNLSGVAGIPSASWNMNYGKIEFYTDAPKIAITSLAGSSPSYNAGMALEIDDRRLHFGGTMPGSSLTYTILDWSGSAAQGRRARKIRIHTTGNAGLASVAIDSASKVWAGNNPNRYRIVVEGDSLTQGPTTNNSNFAVLYPGGCWTDQFANLVGCDDITNASIIGTGFIANNSNANSTYSGRLSFISQNLAPDVLILCGNYNDGVTTSQTVPAMTSATISYLQAARAALPNALIIVFGPWQAQQNGSAAILNSDAALLAAVSAMADPLTVFYSLLTDGGASAAGTSTYAWINGAGQTGTTTGTGNSDIYTGTAGLHPTQRGHDYMARRYAAAFSNIINSIQS